MKQELIKAVASKALEFGDFTLKSGKKSNFYLDVRKLSLSGSLHIVIKELAEVLGDVGFDAIGGPCVGADPIVGGYLALCGKSEYRGAELRGFLVRKEEKDHGKAGLVIGSVQKGDRCVVLEDVTTTGGSLMTAIDAVEAFGGKVVLAVTVVDRLQGARLAFLAKGIPFKSLVTIEDILPTNQTP